LLSAVALAAEALVCFGGPFAAMTVISVELAAEVDRPVAVSRADIVEVDPASALTGIETNPAASTSLALVFDELKVSPDAGSAALVPSL
jgi:hypothetical protein